MGIQTDGCTGLGMAAYRHAGTDLDDLDAQMHRCTDAQMHRHRKNRHRHREKKSTKGRCIAFGTHTRAHGPHTRAYGHKFASSEIHAERTEANAQWSKQDSGT
eukprot:6172681-Pleurochrysis_carterae.AAC.1